MPSNLQGLKRKAFIWTSICTHTHTHITFGHKQYMVYIRNRIYCINYRPVVRVDRKRGVTTFKKRWGAKGFEETKEKSRWIQFQTTCSTPGFILGAFPPGIPPRIVCLDLWAVSWDKLSWVSVYAKTTHPAIQTCFVRGCYETLWLLYSQLQACAATMGVEINNLKRSTIRCSSYNDPGKSLSVRPASQSIISSWPLAQVSTFCDEEDQP